MTQPLGSKTVQVEFLLFDTEDLVNTGNAVVEIRDATTQVGIPVLKGDKGDKGDTGGTGATGATGPAGATGGQGQPTGGSVGQVLRKQSSADYDAVWAYPSSRARTSASTTLILSDGGSAVDVNSSNPSVLTVPANTTAAFPVGSVVEVTRMGPGTVTISPASGVTLLCSVAARTVRS